MINTINNYLYFYLVMFVSLSLALEPTSLVRAATGWPYLDRGTGDENGQDERAFENMQSRGLNTGTGRRVNGAKRGIREVGVCAGNE